MMETSIKMALAAKNASVQVKKEAEDFLRSLWEKVDTDEV